jgi:putative phosphoesterase
MAKLMRTIGVISDTHVPDRARRVNPEAERIFRQRGVDEILHAGDVSVPRVLDDLARIAPVRAVRGNRDWFVLRSLPGHIWINYLGVKVLLTHGHGSLWRYLVERINFIVAGYHFERYQYYLAEKFPEARVIIFGHTHVAVNRWVQGRLFFNPGSAHIPENENLPPSMGILRFKAGGEVEGEIVPLI